MKRGGTATRWFIRRTVVLFGISVAASGLALSAFVSSLPALAGHLPRTLDSGWATLAGAVLGIAVIGWQTQIGFRNLIRSQQNQSRFDREAAKAQSALDREAQRYEAELAIARDDRNLDRDRKSLAAALHGELIQVNAKYNAIIQSLALQSSLLKQMDSRRHLYANPFTFGGIETPIFDVSIDKLGLLGPSLIADVIEIYSAQKITLKLEANTVPPDMIAKLLDGIIDDLRNKNADSLWVNKRLLAVQTGNPDPGALYYERQRRKNAVDDTSNDAE